MLFDVRASPEWALRNRLDYFAFSLELLDRNYAELIQLLDAVEKSPDPVALLSVAERWKHHELLKEVSFRLHNFLAAAKSLLDHSRANYAKHYQRAGMFPEYPDEAKARFEQDGLVQLVHGLREMAQHYRLPNIGWETRIDLDNTSLTITLTLRRHDLLEYTKWRSAAKAYLASEVPEQLSIRNLAEPYFAKISAFYEWVFANFQRIHARDFERLHQMQREELQRNTPEILRGLERDVEWAEQAGRSGNVRELVCSLLTPVEQRHIHDLERKQDLWLEAALPHLLQRIQIPPEMVARLRALAQKSAGAG
jgi:hypothetical protein